jgi:hypothetical protein
LQNSGTLDKFFTKFQEIPTKLKKIVKKFQEALKIFGQIPGDSWNSMRSGNSGLTIYWSIIKFLKSLNSTEFPVF